MSDQPSIVEELSQLFEETTKGIWEHVSIPGTKGDSYEQIKSDGQTDVVVEFEALLERNGVSADGLRRTSKAPTEY